MENRMHHAEKNVVYGLLVKILTMLLEFAARYFFIKYLGSELLGVNGVFTNIIQCLSLAELGVNNVVMFSYYKPLAEKDQAKLSSLNNFYKKIYNGIALCVATLGLVLIPFLKYIINTSYEIPNLTFIYLLFLADTVVSYLYIYKTTILVADQKSFIVTRYDIILNVVRTIFQIVSLVIFRKFIIYLVIKIAFSILGNFLKAKKAACEYPFTKQERNLTLGEKNTIINTIKSGFVYKLSAVMLNSTDNLLISYIVGTRWVGLLSNYVTLCNAAASFVTIVFNNITASVGNLVTTEKNEKSHQIFNVMSMTSNWIAFVCFSSVLILSDEFISLWLGKVYVMDFSVVLPKVMMLYISCVMQPIFCYREALGLYVKTKYVMLLSAIINIVLSIWWGEIWGVSGILVASLFAVLITYFWYEPYILYKDYFDAKVFSYYLKTMVNIVICGLSTLVLYYCSKIFYCWNWALLILKAFFIFIILNVECWLLYRKTEEYEFLKVKVTKK